MGGPNGFHRGGEGMMDGVVESGRSGGVHGHGHSHLGELGGLALEYKLVCFGFLDGLEIAEAQA